MILRTALLVAFVAAVLFSVVLALILLLLYGLVSIGYFFYLHRLALAIFLLATDHHSSICGDSP